MANIRCHGVTKGRHESDPPTRGGSNRDGPVLHLKLVCLHAGPPKWLDCWQPATMSVQWRGIPWQSESAAKVRGTDSSVCDGLADSGSPRPSSELCISRLVWAEKGIEKRESEERLPLWLLSIGLGFSLSSVDRVSSRPSRWPSRLFSSRVSRASLRARSLDSSLRSSPRSPS